MAYPEGSPMHPNYGAGHATIAGACVTLLTAMFDYTRKLPVSYKVTNNFVTFLPVASKLFVSHIAVS